ncbi:hypothetical protein CPB84DRAFT_1742871 [Gymnopilus junonius]|uniref:Uncharacterized protein n=1 Tax=Gymnopilus junonius TaxID=109634 RepID=A0A9P5TTK1_GYMJU|nr:hypothetical protein CPB84DRAFT_1742871 [Gymnopilus junonius]
MMTVSTPAKGFGILPSIRIYHPAFGTFISVEDKQHSFSAEVQIKMLACFNATTASLTRKSESENEMEMASPSSHHPPSLLTCAGGSLYGPCWLPPHPTSPPLPGKASWRCMAHLLDDDDGLHLHKCEMTCGAATTALPPHRSTFSAHLTPTALPSHPPLYANHDGGASWCHCLCFPWVLHTPASKLVSSYEATARLLPWSDAHASRSSFDPPAFHCLLFIMDPPDCWSMAFMLVNCPPIVYSE